MNAKILADYIRFMGNCNKAYARHFFGIWNYNDCVVAHNLEVDKQHSELFQQKAIGNKAEIKEFAYSSCKKCWVAIFGKINPNLVRNIIWSSAYQVMKIPYVEPSPIEHGILTPDFPTLAQHIDFIKTLNKHELLN